MPLGLFPSLVPAGPWCKGWRAGILRKFSEWMRELLASSCIYFLMYEKEFSVDKLGVAGRVYSGDGNNVDAISCLFVSSFV